MMRFDIITIFPEVITPYVNTSILKRAQEKRLVKIFAHDLRRWAKNPHRNVDDKPYGGGPGMVMTVTPIAKAVQALNGRKKKTHVVLFSASGKPFTQRMAETFARKYQHIVFICGRYEGVDHRVAQHIADEEVSIGPYVLTGGEVPAMVVVDAVTRLLPGAIRPESLAEESFSLTQTAKARLQPLYGFATAVTGEYPQYTRPEVFYPNPRNKKISWKVPKVLLSGDHRRIVAWRVQHRRGAKKN